MTSLKALELFGFKSFADRTRFEFPAGVTAVVGPNGSGKSNVVDAIKWVLGEQSPRSLRGKEMTDVIFAGSAARKPLNMAEVTLVFDNSARQLSVAADEVQIMRRVYRGGESEYLVNGEISRLRDIRELFSGTGAATEAYSVIEQGRVDALLVASGRDRRAVFEEAAGITRFRARRAEALRRLERAEQNRQRLADIVGEVAGRLDTVRNQAARARRWRTMTDRLRRLRISAARRDLTGVDAEVAAAEAALAAERAALAAAEQAATEATARLQALAAEADALQPRLATIRTVALAASQREAAASATLATLRARRDDVEAEVGRTAADQARAAAATQAAERGVAEADAMAAACEAEVATVEDRLAACEQDAAGSHDDASAAREALASAVAARDDLRHHRLRLESAAGTATARAGEAARRVDDARDAVAAARARRARLAEDRAAGEGHIGSLQARLAAAGRDVDAAEVALREAATRLQAAWREHADLRAAAEACGERRAILADLVGRHEGVSEAARRLLAGGAAAVPGLAGIVAERIDVPLDLAALVDAAIGRRGQSLLVDSLADVVGWHVAGPATPGGGRVGFVAAHDLPEPGDFEPAAAAGLVGRLDRLVTAAGGRAPASDESLLRRLLGRAWVVDRIDDALPLLAAAPVGTLFVARDGARLAADAGLEVGAGGGDAGLVARRSELREVERRSVELAGSVAAASAGITALELEIDALGAAVATARGRRQQAADTVAAAIAELARIERDERATDDQATALEHAVREAERTALALDAAARQAGEALAAAEAELATAEHEASARLTAIDSLERNRGRTLEEMHRLRVERATAAARLDRARDAAATAHRGAMDSRRDAAACAEAAAEAARRRAAWELDLLTAGERHASAAADAEQVARELAACEQAAACGEAARREAAAARDRSRDEATRRGERIHALDLEAGESRHRRVRIVERIRDEYDIDMDAIDDSEAAPRAEEDEGAEPLPHDRAELEASIEELRRKIAGMGNVNLEALAEAEALAGRLATLEAQLADVTTARESIEQLIARIDEQSRSLLGDTIETVRGHFQDLFERLFGGGRADIVLEPGVDLLETSVEIVARPPGKEPRNISLLSGGEKTMTCVALLLAIFRSRPSPFCVLDEVDAALDEANVDRFVGVLRDFLSSTQFIVVTHSKKTMAAAGTLYGVTMEESGVSKRISVRFETAAATRSANRAA